MPCRHAEDGDGGDADAENFAKTALLLGGPRAIRTAIDREGTPELPATRGERGDRQHDWTADAGECPAHGGSDAGDRSDGSDAGGCPVDHGGSDARDGEEEPRDGEEETRDGHGDRTPSPKYHLLLSLSLVDAPAKLDGAAVERALSALEAELGWGPEGIVAAIGYSPAYFARFEDPVPLSVGVDPAFAPSADPVAADGGRRGEDALLHLASDDARLLLAAEQALWGGDPVIDVELGATLSGVFERPRDPDTRRAAVATGAGLAPEGDASIDRGRFAGGAIQRIDPAGTAGAEEGPSGCPAHGDGRETQAPAKAGGEEHEQGAPNLACLDPEGSVPVSVEFTTPAPDRRVGAESYLVPPTARRSLPVPDGG